MFVTEFKLKTVHIKREWFDQFDKIRAVIRIINITVLTRKSQMLKEG